MDLVYLIEHLPLWLSMFFLFFSALIEYVFPPFPGDTFLIAGGFFVAQGILPIIPTFVVLTIGSTIGCVLGWLIGSRLTGLKKFIGPNYVKFIQNNYDQYGKWIILVNRFIPGLRGAFMIAAGLINVPLKIVIFWGTLSAMLWNSVLIGIGYIFSDNLENLLKFAEIYGKSFLVLIGLVAICYVLCVFKNKVKRN